MKFDVFRSGLVSQAQERVRLTLPERASDAPFGDYLFSDELATAANVALHLGRPLLVTGEPGTGKTALAWGLARQLGAGEVLEFHAKSTSVGRDLLYTVDSMRRFYDAQIQSDRAQRAEDYLTYQALGRAIRSDRTRVVLIDEIDKAPRDFPNDLLDEIQRMRFSVAELNQTFEASCRHFVVITSNSERRLPAPFLRRCVYHHIPFPDPALLGRILTHHMAGLRLSESFLGLVVERFFAIRDVEGLVKPPSTDELLAWTRVLVAMGFGEAELAGATSPADLPALQTLLKLRDDLDLVRAR
jgi:MoxR-like ATPase